MHDIFSIDWQAILLPTTSIPGTIIRGSAMYLLAFFLMRVFRREAGSLTPADLLVIVFVADASQNSMALDQQSVADGAVLVGTIFGWNYLFDFLSYRFRWAHRLLNPRPLVLVRKGQILWHSMRSQLITRSDLMEQLREHGVSDLSSVEKCTMESDGKISVVQRRAVPGSGR